MYKWHYFHFNYRFPVTSIEFTIEARDSEGNLVEDPDILEELQTIVDELAVTVYDLEDPTISVPLEKTRNLENRLGLVLKGDYYIDKSMFAVYEEILLNLHLQLDPRKFHF